MLFQIVEWLKEQEEGQTLVEYALILVLIAIVVIAVLTLTGTTVEGVFQNIVNGLTGAGG